MAKKPTPKAGSTKPATFGNSNLKYALPGKSKGSKGGGKKK